MPNISLVWMDPKSVESAGENLNIQNRTWRGVFLCWTKYNPWLSNVQFLRPRWSEHSRGVQDWEQSESFKLTKCMGLRVRSKCFKLTESPLSVSVRGRACWWVYPSRGETLQTEFYKCAHSSGRHRFRSPPCPEASRTYTNKYSHSRN